MQFITNRIHTGKAKRFEDFIKEYQNKEEEKQVKVASVEEPVKTAEQEEADSSGQLDVEPLHQTGESTTMPKAGPSAKKEGKDEKSAGTVTKEKDEADSSGQPEAEGKLVNKPKVPTKEEKGGEAEEKVKEAATSCDQCKKACDECTCEDCDCEPCTAAREASQVKEAKKALPDALKEHQFKAKDDAEVETEEKAAEGEGEVKEAEVKKEDEEDKKEEKEASAKEEDEEKKEDEKEASEEPQFVKIANLDAKNKAFLKKYWKQLFGEDYANALIADK
jgi:hypothetical protein